MLHQYERVPHHYVIDEAATSQVRSDAAALNFCSTDTTTTQPFQFSLEAVRHNVFRTTFSSKEHPLPPFPSAQRPEPNFEGSRPEVSSDTSGRTSVIRTASTRALVDWSDAPIVSLFLEKGGIDLKPLHRDLDFRSYAADGMGVAHYTAYRKGTLHVGLGEKAAPMDLSGRGFMVGASDTFGYDAYRTDPLYKHIPLLINIIPPQEDGSGGGCVGIFSTSHARGSWAVGSEIDGMWGHFKVYRQAHGGLEEYLIVGQTAAEVVRSYADLVGFPLLVPRYMMGYIGGGMKYSMEDDPRGCDSILNFLRRCAEEDIPVSAFQMSSGYTVAETEPKTRNVFTWNRHRFPDPKAFTDECHRLGVRLLANIKPYVLASHPGYQKLATSGAFFRDPVTNEAAVTRLWSAGGGESGEGSHLDFTSSAGFNWWYEGCRTLKAVGIDAMWNDNNEYTIPSDDWECALETVPRPDGESRRHIGLWGRALHCELMGKSSFDACVDADADERPMVLTRSATAGTMKYAASSWSGDNVTSWESMKGANSLALNAGFSLLQCYGHDIGGFEGPQPTAEHLVRWVQLGVHSPRFAINCYKTSEDDNLVGEVIEPWQYPAVTPLVRAAIRRRYELVPYTYSLCLRSHLEAVPPQRWTGWGYEADRGVWAPEVKAGDTQYWFGDALLVAGVYEPGKSAARVYLPAGRGSKHGYLNTNAPFQHLAAGRWHEVSSVWHTSVPVIARCGSAVPVGKDRPTSSDARELRDFPALERDDWRGVEIFPPPLLVEDDTGGGGSSGDAINSPTTFLDSWLEDDGISCAAKAEMCEFRIFYSIVGEEGPKGTIVVSVEADTRGQWRPLWLPNGLDIILPVGEEREVRAGGPGGAPGPAVGKGRDSRGRRVWHVDVWVVSPER